MKPVPIVISPEAREDLLLLYDYIADRAGEDIALGYTDRLVAYCQSLEIFPERGTRRDDIRPGLRTIGLERRVTIAFQCGPRRVVIHRILYGGRDLEAAFP